MAPALWITAHAERDGFIVQFNPVKMARGTIHFFAWLLFWVSLGPALLKGDPQWIGCLLLSLFIIYAIYQDDQGNQQKSAKERSGSVYVLSNPELPNMVKIGHTTRSAAQRARELSGTGVPGEYRVAHEIPVDRPKRVEKKVHRRLSSYRASDGEFFKVSPQKAARIINQEARDGSSNSGPVVDLTR